MVVPQLGENALGAQQALPDLVADAAAFQQRVQRLLAGADVDDALDVLGAAREEGGAEERVGHLGRRAVVVAQVQQRQVDVPRGVGGEVGGQA
ncbi:hypothetical protein GJ744_003048 [Endocarpon pusillum]|uniref:Uncharacterized protein n=1 Tax=Endocarpon pusillum TaxID=364733 RepID=A0A8H7AB45_9EURO|nr:hypothetical protein GJ744_003048 [Endocarpon pusillum]